MSVHMYDSHSRSFSRSSLPLLELRHALPLSFLVSFPIQRSGYDQYDELIDRILGCRGDVDLPDSEASDTKILSNILDNIRAESPIREDRQRQRREHKCDLAIMRRLNQWGADRKSREEGLFSVDGPKEVETSHTHNPKRAWACPSNAPNAIHTHIASQYGNGVFVTWAVIILPT